MQNQTAENAPAPAGCLLRLLWLVLGNGALYVTLGTIVATRAPLPSYLDVFAGAAVLFILGLRYLDITRFGGTTLQGDPATMRHWRRHALTLIGLATPAWLLAHAVTGSLTGP